MPDSVREIALAACRDSFRDSIRQMSTTFATAMNVVGDDITKKREAAERFRAGLNARRAVHDAALQLVDEIFPET